MIAQLLEGGRAAICIAYGTAWCSRPAMEGDGKKALHLLFGVLGYSLLMDCAGRLLALILLVSRNG